MQSIRAKVMAIFVAFSLLALLLAVLSAVRADREAERLDAILANNAAIQTAAMEALSEARRGEYFLDKALLLTDPRERDTLRLYYSQLQHTTSNFDIFIKVLTWGSNSEAFKAADAGLTYLQWVRRGWHEKLVIRNVPHEIRQHAGVASMYYAGMSKYASTAINALRKALRLESVGRTGTAETVRARGMADVRQAQHYGELVNETLKQLIGATERSARAMRAEIQQVQRSNRLITGAIGLALLLGFTGAGWFYLNRILVQPLQKLMSEVHEIGRGAFSRKVGVNSQDEIGRLAASFNEMTDEIQKKLDELQRQKSLFEAIFNHVPDALVIANEDRKIRMCNPGVAQMFGYTAHELLDKNTALLYESEEEFDRLGRIPYKVEADDNLVPDEASFRRENGEVFPAETIGTVIKASDGKPIGLLVMIRDITDRRQAEAEREALYRRLVDASRQAGKAEIATGVLHNVGNVLNSVNVSATLVADKFRESKIASLTKVSVLLQDHADDLGTFMVENEKGKQLPAYLSTLADHLQSEQGEIISEVQSIVENIDHIKQIVIRQQSYASDSGVSQPTIIVDLLDDALSMNVSERHAIDIVREYDDIPVAILDKHKVLQIVVNLIRNAKQAANESDANEKKIVLRIRYTEAELMRIEVADNGVGIAPDNMPRIFEYGFTTKDHGHGFGLHVSANTAKEMGGSLTCRSEGIGKGATFVLELPFTPAEMVA